MGIWFSKLRKLNSNFDFSLFIITFAFGKRKLVFI